MREKERESCKSKEGVGLRGVPDSQLLFTQ